MWRSIPARRRTERGCPRARDHGRAGPRCNSPVGEMGALFDARLFGRQSPAPDPLVLDDIGKRLPHIGVGGLSLRRRFEACASARDCVWLGVGRKALEGRNPRSFSRCRQRTKGACARRPGSRRSTALLRAPRLQPRRPRCGAFEDRRNRLRPHPRAGMNVIDLERHAQRVAARFQVSGDDIVGVQLPPCFDRVGPARGAPRAADDTPDRLRCRRRPSSSDRCAGRAGRIADCRSRWRTAGPRPSARRNAPPAPVPTTQRSPRVCPPSNTSGRRAPDDDQRRKSRPRQG